jgi:HAD superfamily hydrolase (TIGR01509 family)
MTPHAVLLDMDGTLVDTERLWWRAVVATGSAVGRPVGDGDRAEVVGQAIPHTARHLAANSMVAVDEVAGQLGWRFLHLVRTELTLLAGAADLLATLHSEGIRTGLVSASPRVVVDLVLDVLGRERFECSVAEGETPRTKPHPDPYLAAAETLGVDPGACVAIEDSTPGAASAEAAGLQVVLAPGAGPEVDAPGRHRVHALDEIDVALLRRVMCAERSHS